MKKSHLQNQAPTGETEAGEGSGGDVSRASGCPGPRHQGISLERPAVAPVHGRAFNTWQISTSLEGDLELFSVSRFLDSSHAGII